MGKHSTAANEVKSDKKVWKESGDHKSDRHSPWERECMSNEGPERFSTDFSVIEGPPTGVHF